MLAVRAMERLSPFSVWNGSGASCAEGLVMMDNTGKVFTSCDIADWVDLLNRVQILTDITQGLACVNDCQRYGYSSIQNCTCE